MSQIPVTVLTGFLGAGKTTLLNRILTEKHGRKYAVVVNEFGEIGIDNDLVVNADEEVFEMNNGCICCTVRGDLIRILGTLMKRRGRFDGILVETTGLADPSPVAQTFFVDDDVRARTRLDAIVTVADALNLPQQLERTPEAEEQVAFADIILLNKTDMVSPEALDAVERQIRAINAEARIVRTERCQVPVDELLDRGAFDLDRILRQTPDFLEREEEAHDHHDHDHDHHDHGHDEHDHGEDHHGGPAGVTRHDASVSSISLRESRPLDGEKTMQWLQTLLADKGQDILRTKGILAFKGENRRFVLQAVHMATEGDLREPWKPGENRDSRLVFIGRNLPVDELRRGFTACVAA